MHENHNNHRHQEHNKPKPIYKTLSTQVWITFGVIATIILSYLLTNHRTHVFDVLPYVLVLAMLLTHIGGHGHTGHDGHGSGGRKT